MKALFIDHEFHKLTRSSLFFVDLISHQYDVTHIYVDPELPDSVLGVNSDGYDLVIVWQMDFLAPIFLARGCRTVVIPMYDGSSLMPDAHWTLSKGAIFVNFSRRLHHWISRLGNSSFLVRYFPEPAAEETLPDYSEPRVFFWRRAPHHGLDIDVVRRLVTDQTSRLHIHNAPDSPGAPPLPASVDFGKAKVSVSTWFDEPGQYEKLLSKFNVFVAPRHAEGIGMAFLEAMARGMTVVAADYPTHNEYIANWINGILVNPQDPESVDLRWIRSLGRQAWRTVQLGRAEYERRAPLLLAFLADCPEPKEPPTINQDTARRLIRAYLAGGEEYAWFLDHSMHVLAPKAAGKSSMKSDKPAPDGRDRAAAREVAWIEQNRFNIDALVSGRFTQAGDLVRRGERLWLTSSALVLQFRMDARIALVTTANIHVHLPKDLKPVTYSLLLNDRVISIGTITPTDNILSAAIQPENLKMFNVLALHLGETQFSKETGARVAVGLHLIEFV